MQQGGDQLGESSNSLSLSLPEYKRYGRQMILPSFGLQGQIKLRKAKVLVIGAGGLGCPAVQYLAASGVGHISIVDHDHVETSNLARQILHTDAKVGMNKALSAAKAGQVINPHVRFETYEEALSVQNAVALIAKHDIVLDCTDNVLTRYLISDAAVLNGVQVVSGAGQGLEGQLVVLHKDLGLNASASGYCQKTEKKRVKRGPCYRCLFPQAPRPEDVTDCEDGGVLGGVTGMVGTMQAVEAVKLLIGMGDEDEPPHMTLVSPFSYPPFRSIKLRTQRVSSCRACGDSEQMSEEDRRTKIQGDLESEDYIAFCGLSKEIERDYDINQIDVTTFSELMNMKGLVVDIRPQVEFEIAHLSSSINVPFRQLQSSPEATFEYISSLAKQISDQDQDQVPVYLLCPKAHDSLLAHKVLSSANTSSKASLDFINVKGGLRAWSKNIDNNFPVY